MPIKFGTDGWRGIMGKDYTFENVRLCAQGTADFMKAHNQAHKGLVIGYDTRFASEEFAAAVAEVSTANGLPTFLSDKAAPTPTTSYNLVARNAGGGAIITASHNPAIWNGFKYKPDYGGSASQTIVEELERHIATAEKSKRIDHMSLGEAEAKGLLEYIDPEPPYLKHLASLLDLRAIRQAGLRVIVDPMFGAGTGYFTKLLSGGTTEVTEIHSERNPIFPGIARPEPIAHNLGQLMSLIPIQRADLGIALDADGDRLGLVDEQGHFVTTLQTFAMLCLHQLEILNRRGPLVRSVTMTSMVDRLGKLYGVPVFDTPVGFKHLGPVMMSENALLAGEESGGYAFKGNIPERDGILSGLMVLDLMVKTGNSLSELLDMLIDKVGPHHYDRHDLKFDVGQRTLIHKRLGSARPSMLAGTRVETIDSRDGFRFVLEGGYWAMIRFSGTEPLLRIYAEASSPEQTGALLSEIRALAGV